MVQTRPVRLGFTQTGKMQFISHLDLVRTMGRMIIRAGVPIWYTEGFNPKPKLVFAMNLSVGAESLCEFVDFKLEGDMSDAEVAERIAAQFPCGMAVNGVWTPEHKTQEIAYAGYTITLGSRKASAKLASDINSLLSGKLEIMKRTKSGGEKLVDISPMIRRTEADFKNGSIEINAMLSSGSNDYLNPEYVVKAISEKFEIDFDDAMTEYYTVLRTSVKLSDGVTDFR